MKFVKVVVRKIPWTIALLTSLFVTKLVVRIIRKLNILIKRIQINQSRSLFELVGYRILQYLFQMNGIVNDLQQILYNLNTCIVSNFVSIMRNIFGFALYIRLYNTTCKNSSSIYPIDPKVHKLHKKRVCNILDNVITTTMWHSSENECSGQSCTRSKVIFEVQKLQFVCNYNNLPTLNKVLQGNLDRIWCATGTSSPNYLFHQCL